MSHMIKLGDCLDVIRSMRSESVDAIVTDPPYELGFMGKRWDASGIAYSLDLWREALRVLKPGGHLVAFGGTRTYHRMVCAIEDAGFEIRDSLDWIYGSGFPKSLDVSKAIDKMMGAEREPTEAVKTRHGGGAHSDKIQQLNPDAKETPITAPTTDAAKRFEGWGTALKPAHEPIVLARKPLGSTVVECVLAHGTGALNVDGCRVPGPPSGLKPYVRSTTPPMGGANAIRACAVEGAAVEYYDHPAGRWPPNLLLTHDPRCNGTCAPGCPVAMMDAQSGIAASQKRRIVTAQPNDSIGTFKTNTRSSIVPEDNGGGASRFFPTFTWEESDFDFLYCAKPSKRERNAGCDGLEKGNAHPTVKPVALMRWLCKLVTPTNGIIVDPFMGSGTTLVAAIRERFHVVGIEREASYVEIATRRVADALSG